MAFVYPYTFKERYQCKTCLVKIWFGKKYFFWKSKSLRQSAEQVCRDLSRKARNGCSETDLFFNVATYVRRYRIPACVFEVILTTENHTQLVEYEAKLLKKFYGTSDCLNNTPEPYIPAWIKMTSNKALQSTIIPTDVQVHDHGGEINTVTRKKPSPYAIAHGDMDRKSVLKKMADIKKIRDGKV